MTAERRADSAASGSRVSERGRVGEDDLRGEEQRRGEELIKASNAAAELSWSASDEDSPSDKTIYERELK